MTGPSKECQIAGAFGGGGHGGGHRGACGFSRALIVGEDEELIFQYRAADRAAKLVPVQGQTSGGKGILRDEFGVAQILKRRTVEAVRARLGGRLDQCAGHRSELGVVIAGGQLQLLQRVDVGIDHRDAEDGAVVLCAVE